MCLSWKGCLPLSRIFEGRSSPGQGGGAECLSARAQEVEQLKMDRDHQSEQRKAWITYVRCSILSSAKGVGLEGVTN